VTLPESKNEARKLGRLNLQHWLDRQSMEQRTDVELNIAKKAVQLLERLEREFGGSPGLEAKQILGEKQKKLSVAGFAPLTKEVNWVKNLELKKLVTHFPRVDSPTEMNFYRVKFDDLTLIEEEGLKIPSPDKGQFPLDRAEQPAILLVPGLAFTKKGLRLGRGRGFYDRYLAKSNCITIGLVFDVQLVESLPCDHHDKTVDFVVTEKHIFDCRLERRA